MAARIRKDDLVQVISGKDKGRTGKVLKVFPKENKCIVEKVSVVKRHQKARSSGSPAGIIEKSLKIDLCKLMPVDPKTKGPSRICFVEKDGKKVRQFSKSKTYLEATGS